MKNLRSDLALVLLAVVGVAADLVCILTGHTPPALFDQVAVAGLSGAAGVALQARPGSAPAAKDPE
jgi:NADPH-dependent 2,4-dienoyl-CoA reductase/sulfur reductase-like enzyme